MIDSTRSLFLALLLSLALAGAACQGGNAVGPGSGANPGDVDLGPAKHTVFGSQIDLRDRKRIFKALELNKIDEYSHWTNQYSYISYEFAPTQDYIFNNSPQCRDFKLKIWMNYRDDQATGTACRQDDGSWNIIKYDGN